MQATHLFSVVPYFQVQRRTGDTEVAVDVFELVSKQWAIFDTQDSHQVGRRVVVQLELGGVKSVAPPDAVLEDFEGGEFEVVASVDQPTEVAQSDRSPYVKRCHAPDGELSVLLPGQQSLTVMMSPA